MVTSCWSSFVVVVGHLVTHGQSKRKTQQKPVRGRLHKMTYTMTYKQLLGFDQRLTLLYDV